MDSHLKQWSDQLQLQHQPQNLHQQSDELPSPAKFPRLYLQQADSHPHPEPASESDHQPPVLPLFVTSETKTNSFSAYPDSKPPLPPPTFASSRFACRVGGHFSIAQWQELELQALIFRHMVAGASIPPELLQLVQKSFLNSPSSFYNSYFHPSLMQTGGYWSRGGMDPEPGRCRRTDGKKWRCSRDVVPAQKYCERHVHRGRNRSRKPVESPVPTATATATLSRESSFSSSGQAALGGPQFTLSGPSSSLDIFQLNQGASEPKADRRYLFDQNDTSGDGKSKGRVLRHFFDDWPRSGSPADPVPCLSISTPGGNQSLDFLRLSTGNAGDDLSRRVDGGRNPSECSSGGNHVAAMGGPLAEALRSSTGSSPTSVLHQLARSASGGSYVSA